MTRRRDGDLGDEQRRAYEDEEDARRELEEAGWALEERLTEKIIRRNPESGRLYPQDAAVAQVRERARRGDPFGAPAEEGSP